MCSNAGNYVRKRRRLIFSAAAFPLSSVQRNFPRFCPRLRRVFCTYIWIDSAGNAPCFFGVPMRVGFGRRAAKRYASLSATSTVRVFLRVGLRGCAGAKKGASGRRAYVRFVAVFGLIQADEDEVGVEFKFPAVRQLDFVALCVFFNLYNR